MKKLKIEQLVLPRHQLKDSVLVVKVGSDKHPATTENIQNVITNLNEILKDYDGVKCFVSHHCISFETLSLAGLKNKPKEIEKAVEKASKKVNSKNPALFGMIP